MSGVYSDDTQALVIECPSCLAAPSVWCTSVGLHKVRRRKAAAEREAAREAKRLDRGPGPCECINHIGTPKAQHKSREAAINWCLRGAAKRGLTGMRFEPYLCPKGKCWHIRTARGRR